MVGDMPVTGVASEAGRRWRHTGDPLTIQLLTLTESQMAIFDDMAWSRVDTS